MSNAIKFTPKNGTVQLILEPANNKVSLSVVDSGVGIPQEKIPQLFNKYSKASRLGTEGEKGTGPGLSIVKELVDMHGGTIEVTSEEGKGARFQICFPVLV